MAYELAQAYVQIIPTTKGLTGQMSELFGKDAEKAGADAGGKFSGSFSGALKTLGKAAVGALAAGSGALAAFSATAVKTGMEFDSAISQVAATMGMSMDEMMEQTGTVELAWGTFSGNLRDYAQEMGANTAFSASQAADALNYMALAGYDAQTSMEMLPNVLNLAAAGNMDLALASDMVTDTQSALGLSLEETSVMVDQMAKASSKSNTSVSQLGDAMLKIGATARSVKGGTKELSTVLGVLADNGIKGTEGGTHLRNILLSLQGAAEEGSAVFGDYTVDIYDAEGNMRSLVDIIKDAQDAIGDLSDEGRDAVLSEIFNKTDLAAVNALLGTQKERFDELAEAIGDASGAAQGMADTQLDNLEGDVKLFKSALEGTQIALSDMLTPALREFVQLGSEGLTSITESLRSGDIPGAAEQFGTLLSGGVSKALEHMPKIVEAGGKLLRGLVQGFTENVDSIADGIAQTAVSIADFFAQNTGPFIEGAFKIATGVASALIGHLPEILVSLGKGLLEGLAAIGNSIPELFEGIFVGVFDIFGDWDGLSDEYLEETKLILDRSDELEEAWGKVQEAKNETVNSANAEFSYYSDLVSELDGITDANGRVKEGYEARADFIMGELKEATGLEAELIDGRIKGYDKYRESIENAIKAQRAEAILAAEKKAYDEALASQKELAEQMVDVQNQLEEAQGAYENSLTSFEMRRQKQIMRDLGWNEDAAQKKIEQMAAEESGLASLQAEYDELGAALSDTYTAIGQYEADFKKASEGNYDELGQYVRNWSVGSQEEYEQHRQELEETIASYQKMVEEAEKAVDEGRMDESMLQHTKTMLEGAKEDLTSLETEWQTTITGISQNVTEWFEPTKTGVVNAASEAVRGITTAFSGGVPDVRTSVDKISQAATDAIDTAAKEMPKSGEAITQGLGTSITQGEDGLKTAMESLGKAMLSGFNSILGIASPSREMQSSGENMMLGLEEGLTSGQADVVAIISETAGDMLEDANGYYMSFRSAGANLMNGLIAGMNARSGELERIAAEAVRKALRAARKEGDIKSPSRKMAWIGEMLMEGLAMGIRDNDTAVDAVTKTVNDVNNAMADGLDFGMALDPAMDAAALGALDRSYGFAALAGQAAGETVINITNNIDGTAEPEEFANRLCRQIKMEMRMA